MMRITIPDPSLVILCGPAGSGKSSFAQRHFPRTAVVSSDRCREMIGDDESNMAVSKEAFVLFHQIIDLRLHHRKLTVADSTALSKDARRTLRRLARRAGVPAVLIVFDASEDTCVRRNEGRRRRVGRPVLHQQWLRLQEAIRDIARESYDHRTVLNEHDLRDVRVEIVRPAARPAGN